MERKAILRIVTRAHFGVCGRDGSGSSEVGGSNEPLTIHTESADDKAACSYRTILRSVYGGSAEAGSIEQKLSIIQQLARRLVPAKAGTLDFLYDMTKT